MLKRITLDQVRPGMFIEDMEGGWASNPLQKRRFVLDAVAARQLRSSNVSGVVINTARGADLLSSPASDCRHGGGGEACLQQAAAAVLTVRQSVTQLKDLFSLAASDGPVSVDQTKAIASAISRSVDDNPAVFISVTRLKDKDEATFVHSVAVSALMIHFGRYLRLDEPTVELLGVAGLLHDIGKIKVPRSILCKQGVLDEAETRVMRDHPMLGYDILTQQEDMQAMVTDICRHHHERVDGKGYPDKLSGRSLTYFSRLAAICDVYDAVTSTRPYRKPWSSGEALKWMIKRDGHFDRQLLKKFILCLAVCQPVQP
ncbi:HD-GYP domain-containing protein [Rhizobium tumorigenes]|uniref:HD-GYP domain-containing protein n=1 Tax=Rhizobium tumorigenes TaxID=2041385 RepID=UPI00241EF0E1|nr:HD-GYP domain-containing protein [Rhizobium tumorigenes]WFR99724.1 HD-GYP domain-containing protein [Rhizobium tumorigenes]